MHFEAARVEERLVEQVFRFVTNHQEVVLRGQAVYLRQQLIHDIVVDSGALTRIRIVSALADGVHLAEHDDVEGIVPSCATRPR